MPGPARVLLAFLTGLAVAMAGCGAGNGGPAGASGTIVVLAAASLTNSFTEMGAAFSTVHPETAVRFSFAASSTLAHQVVEGAPADVFVSADVANMQRVVDAGANATRPQVFATNRLAIVVERGNPHGIAGLADLARPDVAFVACAPAAPCGRLAQQVLANAGVAATPKSLEESVRAVLAKIALGEADAGIVFATDVFGAGDHTEAVAIPPDINAVSEYPIVVTVESRHPERAAAFAAFVTGPDGQAILARHGFGPP